jgi:preprotein translocase subunit SecG
MGILIGFLTVVQILVAIFLIIIVLMQKSKDQGVGAAFGGATTEAVFGAGTTTALVRMTIWCACIFLGCSLVLAVLHSHYQGSAGESSLQKAMEVQPAAPSSSTPVLPMTPEPGAPTAPTTTTPAAPETPTAAPAQPATPSQPAPAPAK